MKKLLTILFALLLLVSMAACGNGGKESEKPDSGLAIKTMGEAFRLANDYGTAWGIGEDEVVVAFYGDDYITRYSAHFGEEIYNKLEEIDFFDEKRDEKYADILDAVPVEKVEDLTDKIPDETKCNSFVGKTGQELLDMGAYLSGYDLNDADNPKFFVDLGLFEYVMTFDGHVDYTDDLDEEETIKPLTVKAVEYQTVSNDITELDVVE